MSTASTSITINGYTLNHAEQRTLMIVAAAQDVGICPAFHRPHETTYRRCAEELVSRGLLYRVSLEWEDVKSVHHSDGYAITTDAEESVQLLIETSGLDHQDIIPHPPARPTDAGPAATVTPIEVGIEDDEVGSPYVILHGDRDAIRAFAAHLYDSIEVTIKASQE